MASLEASGPTRSQGNPRVVIVGAGPVGLSCALALRALSCQVEVLEADDEHKPRPGSRALFLHRDSLSLLERFSPGLGRQLAAFGTRWRYRETHYRGRLVYRKELLPEGEGAGWPAFASIRQPDTEALLRKACSERGIPIRWGSKVAFVTADATGVLVGGEGFQQRAEYLIAADGARSAIRKHIGVAMSGQTAQGCHIVVDFQGDSGRFAERRVFHYHHPLLDGRHVLIIPFAGGWQVDLQCKEADDVDAMAEGDGLLRWLRHLVDADRIGAISWVSTYRFNQVVADDFSDPRRRVLLVGEAAHLFPPYGARGLNSGVADADAAASAIALAGHATSEERRIAAIEDFVRDRRVAALRNRDAAMQALHAIRTPTWGDALRQRAVREASRWWRPAARWLDAAPYGPAFIDERRSTRY
ncbi:FAD-dependent monooxygenase [Rubrivivax sp. RP6-9]|uniref:FAD-dependent monooxygenase n=1 Tax=Rubrivivax sp. RP6-9 TaxID=3415750 RepID=UPI003CC68A43